MFRIPVVQTAIAVPRTALSLAVSSLFLLPGAVAASPIGGEFVANKVMAENQFSPSVATDARGDFVVVWQSNIPGSVIQFMIRARRYNAAGTAQGGEIAVSPDIVSYPSPTVAMDAAGAARGEQFAVSTDMTPGVFQNSPGVAIDPDGDFVIV